MAGPAPIFSTVEDTAQGEAAAWARFAAARDSAELWGAWLSILCLQIGRVGGGLLLIGPDEEGAFTPAAVWPRPTLDMQYLSSAAERTLNERRGIVISADGATAVTPDQRAYVGYPIEVSGTLRGAVVLDVAPSAEAGLQRTLRLLHWASAWLIDEFRRRAQERDAGRLQRTGLVMDLVATAVQERRAVPAAMAVVNELAARLDCARVSIGFEHDGVIRLAAISNTATFNARMKLARLIADAMEEALDLDSAIVHPPHPDEDFGAMAHGELAREFRDAAICSAPLLVDRYAVGVITLERSEGEFDAETIEMVKAAGAVLGPIFALQRDNNQGFARRAFASARTGVQMAFGPGHPGLKMIVIAAAAAIAFFTFTTGLYRIAAKTVVEGAVQRVTAAPFDGYILQAAVRAGDTVKQGDTLARLDDKELILEQTRLAAEREQLLRRQRQALATRDRAQVSELASEIDQVAAASDLVAGKLVRATLKAPFDGVVVSGDLSQLLGAPVEQGKALFQIAPLDAYRVILEVDERDVAGVAVGQKGELTLSSSPSERWPFTVQRITPVSTTQEGRNFFRVEAHLENGWNRLRPGMEGVGKVEVDRRRLIWIWTHGLTDWLRLAWWKWGL